MPFGEYVLGADAVPELRGVFRLGEEFDAGRDATVLTVDGTARLGVMLCYEEVVPSTARSLVAQSATLLVTLLNGAAFPDPLTLSQQRRLAQLRAVENRRCLLRCASTGETCVVSPLGGVVAAIPVQTQAVLTATVPLLESRTLASRIGLAFPLACGVALAWLLTFSPFLDPSGM
jgi:apolipoprotein N-acyltransferase